MTSPSFASGPVRLFGLEIEDATLAEAAASIISMAGNAARHDVAFVNAHCVNVAASRPAYRDVLHRFQRLYADGAGMRAAARLAGYRLRDNVNGTDLFPQVCALAARQRVPIAMLGARPGVAQRCACEMSRRFPGLNVVWVHHGFAPDTEVPALLESLARSRASVLFVALGVPTQEIWIHQHRSALAVPVTLAVGALFDFYSGDVPRAPFWLRKLGLEWVFRLALEPRRLFRRYVLGNPRFISRAVWLALWGRIRDAPLGRRG